MEHEVFLPCPAGAVRAALGTLADPERLARCVPGLQLDADPSGAAASGRLKLRIGSSSITYRGTLALTERGEGVDVQAEGTEARGSGTASVLLSLVPRPVEDGSGTTLSFSGTVEAKGRLTDFDPTQRETAGRRLLDRFAAALVEVLGADGDVLGADGPGPDAADAGRDLTDAPAAAGGASAADAAAVRDAPDAAVDAAPESEDGLDEPGPAEAVPSADAGAKSADAPASAGAASVADGAAGRDVAASADAGPELEGGLGESESAGAGPGLAGPGGDAAAESAEGAAVAGVEPGAEAGPGSGDAGLGREACADEEDVPVVGGIGGPEDNEPVIPGIPAAPEERGGAEVEVPAPAIDPEEEAVAEAAGVTAGPPEPEADFARRTMIGRSAEEVDHAPPRGRYAPAPAPGSVPDPASTLRWAAPTAALAVASALVLTRTLRRRARRRRS